MLTVFAATDSTIFADFDVLLYPPPPDVFIYCCCRAFWGLTLVFCGKRIFGSLSALFYLFIH